MLSEISGTVARIGATRVVIDSLSGFEVALAPSYREDFRESLYRLVGALTATGVTVLMTAEVIDPYPDGRFTSERVSFITDDIIVQRYVEIDGHLKKVLAVVKMRGSGHATNFRTYELTAAGAIMNAFPNGATGVEIGGQAGHVAANNRHQGWRSASSDASGAGGLVTMTTGDDVLNDTTTGLITEQPPAVVALI